MRRLMLVFIVANAAVMLPSQPSWSCSCVRSTPMDHADRADVIFTRTATDPDSQDGVHTYWTGFEVEIVYKGTLGPRAAVETVGDSAASCGIVFKEGKRYTVFARAQEDGLDTNICMGTTGGSIESRSYGLTAKPISSGEMRFAPEGGIAWWLWMGIALGSVLLLGAGIAILGRHRSRVRGAGRFD